MTKAERHAQTFDQRVAIGAILLERARPGCLLTLDIDRLSFAYDTPDTDIIALAMNMGAKAGTAHLTDFCPELRADGVNLWQFGFCPCCDDAKEPTELKEAWLRFMKHWRLVLRWKLQELKEAA